MKTMSFPQRGISASKHCDGGKVIKALVDSKPFVETEAHMADVKYYFKKFKGDNQQRNPRLIDSKSKEWVRRESNGVWCVSLDWSLNPKCLELEGSDASFNTANEKRPNTKQSSTYKVRI